MPLPPARGAAGPSGVYAEHGGRWTILDADGRVPDGTGSSTRTASLLDTGVRPGNNGIIYAEEEVPAVLICANEVPPVGAGGL